MAHLLKFRKGWQSENLAKYILSKFSFVAEPSTISDDLGSDFFCTLFNIAEGALQPRNSFAIQIKSNDQRIRLKDLKYLSKLTVPFLIGVADKKRGILSIYSGECLSSFFSYKGDNLGNVYIKLADERNHPLNHDGKNSEYILEFPKIIELGLDFDYEKNPQKLNELFYVCDLTQDNIVQRKNSSYIFKRYKSNIAEIFAGPASISSFRASFVNQLTQVFFNLEHMLNNGLDIVDEFRVYENLYINLKKLYKDMPLPPMLKERYEGVKKIIDKDSTT